MLGSQALSPNPHGSDSSEELSGGQLPTRKPDVALTYLLVPHFPWQLGSSDHLLRAPDPRSNGGCQAGFTGFLSMVNGIFLGILLSVIVDQKPYTCCSPLEPKILESLLQVRAKESSSFSGTLMSTGQSMSSAHNRIFVSW